MRTDMRVGEVMSAGPATIAPDESVGLAIERMRSAGARHLPVVRGRSLEYEPSLGVVRSEGRR
jgi:CBS domain-containing protein